jgi:hypothetical protein
MKLFRSMTVGCEDTANWDGDNNGAFFVYVQKRILVIIL